MKIIDIISNNVQTVPVVVGLVSEPDKIGGGIDDSLRGQGRLRILMGKRGWYF